MNLSIKSDGINENLKERLFTCLFNLIQSRRIRMNIDGMELIKQTLRNEIREVSNIEIPLMRATGPVWKEARRTRNMGEIIIRTRPLETLRGFCSDKV